MLHIRIETFLKQNVSQMPPEQQQDEKGRLTLSDILIMSALKLRV